MMCPMCGEKNCSCLKWMWVLGVIFLVLAWASWTETWPLNKIFAVVFLIYGVKKIAMSFMKK